MQTPTLLYVECAAPGLLRLDGAPFAQTPAEGLCRYVARTALTMEFLPMGNPPGGVFLPFARQIDLSADAPRIFENDGAAELFVLPAEAFALRLHPPALPRPQLPRTLTQLRFSPGSGTVTAEICADADTVLLLSDAAGNVLFACSLCAGELKEPRLFTRRMEGRVLLFAEGKCEGGVLFACVDPASRRLLSREECLSYRLLDAGAEWIFPLGAPEVTLHCRTDRLSSGGAPSHRVQTAAPLPARSAGIALAEAVRLRDGEAAMSLLEPSLRAQLSFSDLCEFWGETDGVYLPLCRDAQVAVCQKTAPHMFSVRLFDFAFAQGKIADLTEQ